MIIARDPVAREKGIGEGNALPGNLLDHGGMLDHVEHDQALIEPPVAVEIHERPGADQPPAKRDQQKEARAAPGGRSALHSADTQHSECAIEQQHARHADSPDREDIQYWQDGERQEHRPAGARPEAFRRRQSGTVQQPQQSGAGEAQQHRREQRRADQTAKIL